MYAYLKSRPAALKLGFVLLVLALIVGAVVHWRSRSTSPVFPGIEGPAGTTIVADQQAPRIADLGAGGPSRLAVLVTDPSSDWTGLLRTLHSRGIPVTFTRDPGQAVQHHAVLVYPAISGRLLEAGQIKALAAFVHGGGGLMTFDLAGGGLEPLFGVSGEQASRSNTAIRWPASPGQPPSETRINAPGMEISLGSLGIVPTDATVLARFDNGSAAATCHRAVGEACLIGLDVGSFANRLLNLRADPLARTYANGYEDGLDRLIDRIRDFYVANEPDAYLIGTAPAPYPASLVLTHDLDAQQAVHNSVNTATALRQRGLDATFFMQTKYVRDWNDEVFFKPATIPALARIKALGMEIGSHGVAHARAFKNFELGSGKEAYPDYRPFVTGRETAKDGTVLGELRVSKFLLERMLGGTIVSFRPGHLENPPTLPQALAATGYRFTSDLTANNVLSSYPFQLAYGRAGPGLLPVWNFPVTIEDEAAPAFVDRVAQSQALVGQIASRGGTAVILVHPDQGPKLRAELAIVDHFRGKLWIGSMGRLGEWWRARDLASVDFDGRTVTVGAQAPLSAVRISFPRTGRHVDVAQGAGVQHYPAP